MDERIIGIDIGGTKIAVCRGTAEGAIEAREHFETASPRGPDAACDRIAAVVAKLSTGFPCHDVIGVSAAGPLSSRTGRFIDPPNLHGWHGFPIVSELERRTGRRVRLMNDANAAAAAEWRFGAGRGAETLIYYTYSTGMGAGLVVSGRLHEGADDMAGEVGHIRVSPDGPAGFGRRGSLEGFCSGTGIAQLAVTKLHEAEQLGRSSKLFDIDRDWRTIDAEDVGRAARAGDAVALAVFEESARRLGEFSAMMVDILNPDIIVLGTIGRIYQDLVIAPMKEEIDRRAHASAARRVRIVAAELGERTGDVAAICAALLSITQDTSDRRSAGC